MVLLAGDRRDAPQKLHAVDRVNGGERAHRAPRLVRLQPPDEVPLEVRQRGDLRLGLLDTVLAKDHQSRFDGAPDDLDAVPLRDRHDPQPLGVMAVGSGRLTQAAQQMRVPLRDLLDAGRLGADDVHRRLW